jgi:TM2 domain-containing membrane protein YozV
MALRLKVLQQALLQRSLPWKEVKMPDTTPDKFVGLRCPNCGYQAVAFLMLFIFGAFGLHQIYLGRIWRAAILFLTLGVSYLCFILQSRWWGVSIPLGVIGALICIFDAITLPWQVRKVNSKPTK